MKESNGRTITMFICLLLFLVMVGLLIFVSKVDQQTQKTTTSYTASVSSVQITQTGKNSTAEIYTNEYTTSLHISSAIYQNINTDDLKNLQCGQTIFFSIENGYVQQMNKVDFLPITSLKTDTNDILSLEKYNQCMHEAAVPARIVGIIAAVSLLIVSLSCYVKNKRARRNA